ncbi:hypothetical protein ALC57_15533, partial [Trachymyrmex cornetzi]
GMPPARAIIHYLTSSHVFPVHPACPDVQRNVRVRQTGGGAKAKRMRHGTAGLGNQMSDICKKYFLRDLYRKIDGAVLTSQNERDLDCAITFQTHSILQRFMLRFDQLQLDCNDHLYIYDGAHAVGSYKVSRHYEIHHVCVPKDIIESTECSALWPSVANYRGGRFDKTISRSLNDFDREDNGHVQKE